MRDDLHRQGIGLTLIEALLGACAAKGYRQAVAVIGDSANLASIRLHERAGFVRAGLLEAVGWKHGRWLDVVQMQHTPGRGSTTTPQLIR